jgi:hypothetical protein
MKTFHRMTIAILAVAACAALSLPMSGAVLARGAALSPARSGAVNFSMVRSSGATAANCLPDARGYVTVIPGSANDLMRVYVAGLPANTGFDLFVLQLPDAPFGVAWYQSDLQTNAYGQGYVSVRGVFDVETFSLSQAGPAGGSDPTQGITGTAVTDTNVTFRPTHQYHLGLWFNSPDDAAKAGCPSTVTPFNGEQHAGIQALSTHNFPIDAGPLSLVHR